MNKNMLRIKNTSYVEVEILQDEPSILEAKAVDDFVFRDHQGITLDEITAIAKQGGLLGIRSSDGKLIAEAQIIFYSIPGICNLEPGTALCYGSAVHPSYRRLGLGHTLMKAKEILSSERNIKKLTLTVRPENASAILLWLKCGFTFYGYDPNYFEDGLDGGRLLMEKVLGTEKQLMDQTSGNANRYKIEIKTGVKTDIHARKKLADMAGNNYTPIDYKKLNHDMASINILKS